MNPLSKGFGFGFAAGLAVGIALPVIVPAFVEASRPVAKALVKHALLGAARVKTTLARASEAMEDFMAEVRSEVERELDMRESVTPERTGAAETADAGSFAAADAKVYS
jgi:hypothetical protein